MENTKKFADTAQYIVISMGDEQFGIDIKYIDNIVKMQHITRVPNVASYIKGVINLRGEVLPVMSLRLKMGLEDDVTTKNTRIIILRLEQYGMIGIIVDEVREVITLNMAEVEKTEKKAIYRVVYDKENKEWLIKKDGATRVIRRVKTKAEALELATQFAENQDLAMSVQKKDGKFQKKSNYTKMLPSDKKD